MLILPPAAVLASLAVFAAANVFTPGPNNIMLMTSGVNFGVRATIPQMLGIFTGFITILIGTGLGLGLALNRFPALKTVLIVVGVAYTLWLAWKMATRGTLGAGNLPHPMPFSVSLAFQAVNAKLWVMAVSAMALYGRIGHVVTDTLLVALVFSAVNIPAMLVWTGFGAGLRDFLQVPGRLRFFNVMMGVLLAFSVIPLLRI